MKRNGFTLIELMMVSAIIGLLATIAIPKFANMIGKAKEAKLKGNIGAFRSALSIYYADTEGILPPFIEAIIPGYINLPWPDATYLLDLPGVDTSGHAGVMSTRAQLYANKGWAQWTVAETGVLMYSGNMSVPNRIPYNFPRDHGEGKIYVDCDHTDLRGQVWSTY